MNKAKRFAMTMLTTGMATILSFAINFFLTPLITNSLGTAAYGFVSLAKTFTNYALILTIALNSYAARFITIEYHQDNLKEANKYMSSVFWSNVILGIGFVSAIFIAAPFFDVLLSVPKELSLSVKVLFVVVFISFSITCISTAFTVSAYIKNRLDLVGLFKTLSYLIEVVLLVFLFKKFEAQIWYVGIAQICSHFVLLIGNIAITRRITPDLHVHRKDFSFHAVKKLVINGVWNSINSLGNTLNAGLDLIICNIYLTGMQMGQLAIAKTILSIFSSFYALLSQPFQPIFLKSYSEHNTEQLIKDLKLAMKLSGGFINIVFAGFVAVGVSFYNLWIPGQDTNLIYRLTVLTIMTSITEGAMYPLYYIYTLTVKNKIPCIITIIGGVLNVAGMIVLLNYTTIGIYGIVLTTTVIMSIINLVTNPIYMACCLKVSKKTFYPSILRNLISCFGMVVLFCFIARFMDTRTWLSLIFTAAICSIIGILVHLAVAFSKEEKAIVIKFIKRKMVK